MLVFCERVGRSCRRARIVARFTASDSRVVSRPWREFRFHTRRTMATRIALPASLEPPAEALAAVVRDAERDADGVAALLDEFGFRRAGPGDPPVRLPAQFLLGLGVVMRLATWESKGLFAHREVGIPSVTEVLQDVVRRTARLDDVGPDPAVVMLWLKVLDLSIGRFAWEGQSTLGADVLVGDADEDALLDALARLCWACREGRRDHEKAE